MARASIEKRYAVASSKGNNQFEISAPFAALRSLDIDILVQNTAARRTFPIKSAADLAGLWELWQHYYFQTYYLGGHFEVARYSRYNEPNQSLAIKGVIWYQGESDASRHAVFARQFATLIADWRKGWGREDMPWLFVQLAPYSDPKGKVFPLVWEAQQEVAQRVGNVAMALTLNVGKADEIHPPFKEKVGARLFRKDGTPAAPFRTDDW